MMRLPKFEYRAPHTIADAVKIISDVGAEAQFVAGGTDLYPNMKRRQLSTAEEISRNRPCAVGEDRDSRQSHDRRCALGLSRDHSIQKLNCCDHGQSRRRKANQTT